MNLARIVASAESSTPPHRPVPPDANGWALYRDRTTAMLRKYFRMSLDLGRVPSILGGQLFRARITAYQVHNFEDVVIFVHDMERCLRHLDALSRLLIARVVLEEFDSGEVAAELRTTRRQINRRLEIALDKTSELLVAAELMQALHNEGLPPKKRPARADSDRWWTS